MNPFTLPPPAISKGSKAMSGLRIFALVAGVIFGLPALLIISLFAYYIAAGSWASWRFHSHELNQKIVAMNRGWDHSSEQRDVSSLFFSDISRNLLQQQLESVGHRCKVETIDEVVADRVLSCETQAGYDTFCTRSVTFVAVFDESGRAKAISANPFENC